MAASLNFSRTSNFTLILKLKISLLILYTISPSFSRAGDVNSFDGGSCGTESFTTESSLNTVFNSLETNVNLNGGFYMTQSNISDSEEIYSLIQCRGDISPSDCLSCTQDSFDLAAQNCQGSASVIVWQRWCTLHYSNVNFFGSWQNISYSFKCSQGTNNYTDDTIASRGLQMMSDLVSSAPLNKSAMFDKSEVSVGEGMLRYGMMQCTRDLGQNECKDCLNDLLTHSGNSCLENNAPAMALYSPGCAIWYDDSQFYFTINSSSAGIAPSPHAPDDDKQAAETPPHKSASRAWATKNMVVGILLLFTTAMAFDIL